MNFGVILGSVSPSLSALIIVVIIIISISAVLIILELMLKKRNQKEIQEISPEEIKIEEMINAKISPEKKLEQLSEISKGIFKEKFNFSQKESYSELLEDFKKTNNQRGIQFCRLMSDFYYSPRKPAPEKVKTAILILSAMVKGAETPEKEQPSEPNSENAKIHYELEKIFSLKEEVDSLIKKWRSQKLAHELEKAESAGKAMILISKNQEEYSELKESVSGIKIAYEEFDYLLSRTQDASQTTKKLAKIWKKENEEAVKKTKNPFKYYSECLNLLDKHLTNLGIILIKKTKGTAP